MKEKKRFEMIECMGTPYEIGLQWGEGGKKNILEAIAESAMKYFPGVKDFYPELIEFLGGYGRDPFGSCQSP